ncbi:MAG: endonuclease MutS2 [Firmicutes bacterium]|nr:endonuclease MutS2 [Bacillota bacterium]
MPVATAKTKAKLEWEKIISQLTAQASTSLGKELCRNLEPSANMAQVVTGQTETAEAVGLLCRGANVPLAGISNIKPLVFRCRRGGILSIDELYAIKLTIEGGHSVRTFLLTEGQTSFFVDLGSNIPLFPALQSELTRCILGPEELADEASLTLQRLRRDIIRLENKIREHLDAMVHSSTIQKYLQEPLVTIRNDRYVLPVKQEYRQHIPGIVHDQSASGATLFVEPLTTFELGNQLRALRAEEQHEVERILADLSSKVAQESDGIEALLVQLARLDFIMAKGKLALAQKASAPKINHQGYLELQQARHPLLGSEAVPVTMWLGRTFRILVVTGPNTGGKTVLLKTIGLLVLMNQAGLHIPAQESSELPIFDHIFCDIGDEQSIEQNLSTFSAHMTNIVSILKHCTPNSLVLIDELGAGTDPSEGAALGMAVLEYLYKIGTSTVATTHYSELKVFAYTHPGVENASVEFDPITLRPTYRLIIGLPGRSNAFDIACRLGLPKSIVEQARLFMTHTDVQTDELIRSLEEKRQHLDQLIIDANAAKKEAETTRSKWEQRYQALTAKEETLIRRAKEDAITTVNYARREAESIIKELRSETSRLLEKDRTLAADKARSKLAELSQVVHDQFHQDVDVEENNFSRQENPTLTPTFHIGQTIYIPHLKAEGTIIDPPDSEGNVRVQVGILKMTFPWRQLRTTANSEVQSQNFGVGTLASTKAQTISPEIDLRGLTSDDAEYNLSKYLDDARLAGLHQIRIIHGKGTGTLRQTVHDFLKNHPEIASFSLAGYHEGGTGVTIAWLKK